MAAPWRGVFPGTWQTADAAFFSTPPGMLVSEAMLGPVVSGAASMALAAIEGADTCSSSMDVVAIPANMSLSATEGADTAASSMNLAVSMSLSAVEGADTASGTVAMVQSMSLAATDGADLASVSMVAVASMALSAVEGADLCAGSMDVVAASSVEIALSAVEGADLCTAEMGNQVAQEVDKAVYGMGGTYTFGGSSVPVEDDDETLDGFLRAVPIVPATPLAQPSAPRQAPIASGPTDLDRAMLHIVSKPAPEKAVPDLQTLASQEAEALRKKHHNHALRLLLLAS